MSIYFDSSYFGRVVINGKAYGDVLIIGEKVEERDDQRLDGELGTDHLIGDWEAELLLSNNPEIIVIGTGTVGILKVAEKVKEKFLKAGVELIVLTTPRAIEKLNLLVSQGKRVNALIHTTC